QSPLGAIRRRGQKSALGSRGSVLAGRSPWVRHERSPCDRANREMKRAPRGLEPLVGAFRRGEVASATRVTSRHDRRGSGLVGPGARGFRVLLVHPVPLRLIVAAELHVFASVMSMDRTCAGVPGFEPETSRVCTPGTESFSA